MNLILEKTLDLLIITETWLFTDDDAKMRGITPEGYCMFSNPRDARRGGGVAIICKNGIICKMKERNDLFESFEFLQLDVVIDSKRVSIFPIYRPEPNVTSMNVFLNEFSDLLEETRLSSHYILGRL